MLSLCPYGCKPLLLGNLNINLQGPVDLRADTIKDVMDEADLVNLMQHFMQQGGDRIAMGTNYWSWQQRCWERWVRSPTNYVMARDKDKCLLRRMDFDPPRHHDSDHHSMVTWIWVQQQGSKCLKAYCLKRHHNSLKLQPYGPYKELKSVLKELRETIKQPPPQKQRENAWISE